MTTPESQPERIFGAYYLMGYYGSVWRYSNGSYHWQIALLEEPQPYPILGSGWGTNSNDVHKTMNDTIAIMGVMYGYPHMEEEVQQCRRAGYCTPSPTQPPSTLNNLSDQKACFLEA